MVTDKPHPVHYSDFQIQELFEGICEQVLDYLGIEEGRKRLKLMFKGFDEAIEVKIKAYKQGKRITHKCDVPDESIKRICEGWE